MSGFWAVTEREIRALVRQPVAWIVTAIFLFLHGLFFAQLLERYSEASMRLLSGVTAQDFTLIDRVVRPLLIGDSFVFLLILPALTMRQMAEEWRSGTSDLLLTYPLSEVQVIGGKFFASSIVVTAMLVVASLYSVVASFWGDLEIPVMLLGHFGVWLYALMVIAIGLSMSTLTDNQVIAFASTFMVLLGFVVVGNWGVSVSAPWDTVLRLINFTGHIGHFGYGELRLSSVVFFVGITGFFLHLAVGTLGRRRWRALGRKSA